MSRSRWSVGPALVLALAATALIGSAPTASAPATVGSAPGAAAKPFSAGTVQIDPSTLAGGEVSMAVDPLPGFTDASVTVSATGEATATGSDTPVSSEASTISAEVTIDGPTTGDPSTAALADASGSAVTATLSASDADGTVRTASDTVWVDEFEGQVLVSETGEQDLRLQRVGVLEGAGTVTAEEAEALREEIRGGGAATTESFVPGSCVDLCVSGTVLWTDAAGGTHPVDRAPVQIREDNAGTDNVITTVMTDGTGAYTATINNTDPEGGDRDIYVRVRAEGPGTNIHAPAVAASHFIDSTVDTDIPDGSEVTQDLTANNTLDNNTAFAIQASLVFANDYLVGLHGSPFPTVPVVFPSDGSYFDGTSLNLLELDRWDWDVSLHEYGHFIADQINIENNPGGPHSGSQNLSDSRGSKAIGIPLAWGEGWPTFFAVSALRETAAGLGIPNVGDTFYQDTEDQIITDNLEANGGNAQLGEDNERTVMNILWDLYDANEDGRDHTALGAQVVWDRLDDNDPKTLSAAYRLFSANRTNEGVNCIATQMNVSPRLNGPASVNITANAPAPHLAWARGNGGTHRNNSFTVRFRGDDGAMLFTSPVLHGQTYTPPAARWAAMKNQANGTIGVSVVGTQTDNPRTGPYRSCTKAFVIGG